MTDLIRHRGPDDEGYLVIDDKSRFACYGGTDTPGDVWKSDFSFAPSKKIEDISDSAFKLAFGHRRLSILDLSPAGHQPMSFKNCRYWIVFNGELYNYKEIRNELQGIGYQFISRTDTEVVLAAYSEWGAECLKRFAGMWAFAIYDHTKKEIFLARDRYGIKPLYYWFSPFGQFCFASEIKQFTGLKGWQSKMNRQKVYDQLVYSFTDHTDETMFSGVYQLSPGTYFRSAIGRIIPDISGRINFTKWYFLKREPFNGTFNEAAVIFRHLFEISVKEHLNADVPVGTALSGGLDSSSIVCLVNRLLLENGKSKMQKTFSSCSIDERFDERKWMEIVINTTKVEAHFSYPNLNEAIELTPDLIWHQDEPYQSQSAFLAFKVFNLAKDNHVKVLLNGQGADEYLGGYGQFTSARYANMILQLRLISLIKDIRNLKKNNPVSNLNLLKGIAFSILPSFVLRLGRGITSSTDHIKQVIDFSKFNLDYTNPRDTIAVKYKTIPEISEHLTFHSTLPKYLHWEDRNSMANSVEARVPFLDHRLVEFAYSLPDNFLEKDGITKRVMREAMSDLLPMEIKNRKDKMGFTTPEELWIKKENPVIFKNKILEAINITNGIIKPTALAYFDKVVNGKVPFDYTYQRLILFGEWIKRFQIEI